MERCGKMVEVLLSVGRNDWYTKTNIIDNDAKQQLALKFMMAVLRLKVSKQLHHSC